jgi:hypothetical protein
MSRSFEHALLYANFGWAVLPIHAVQDGQCTCGRGDCLSPGKHPRTLRGVKDATRDEEMIRSWWGHLYPDANVGIATGRASALLVLDIDPRHGGDHELAKLEAECGKLPTAPISLTGGGGQHILFRRPGTGDWRNKAGIRPGIDIRGDEGFIVAPPSIHASSGNYAWDLSFLPRETAIPDVPAWLLELLGGKDSGSNSPAARPVEVWRDLVANPILEGGRNQRLTELAGLLLRRWVDPFVALELLLSLNRVRCVPPLGDHEVYQIVNSIAGAECRRRGLKR